MTQYSKNINQKMKEYKSFATLLFNEVNKAKKIAIFAHKSADFDAFGSEFGLASYLKENYKNKEIVVIGEDNPLYMGDLYPFTDKVSDEWFKEPFLALVVDTATQDRAFSDKFKLGNPIIKIDHHPNVDPFGDVMLVDTKAVAVSEMITILALCDGKVISKQTGIYLYSGIVGDSGRFRYASTTATTFAVAEVLINIGVDINSVYTKLYSQELSDLKVMGYILNNYNVTPNGFVYYIVDFKTQQQLNINADQAKENVNVFSGIRGVKAWAAITERPETNEWRVSIRSASKPIDQIALKWRGGGHVQASGASLLNKEEISVFVQEMDEYLKD